jgi:acyl dehydratase
VVLEQFETDKRVAYFTCDEAFRALGNDVDRQIIHVDELMARETFGLVVFIIHMLGQFRFHDKDVA